MNRLEFERIALELMSLSKKAIDALLLDDATPMQTRIVARLLTDAGNGDPRSFESLMNRLHGRTRSEPAAAEEKQAVSFVELVMEAEAAKKES